MDPKMSPKTPHGGKVLKSQKKHVFRPNSLYFISKHVFFQNGYPMSGSKISQIWDFEKSDILANFLKTKIVFN